MDKQLNIDTDPQDDAILLIGINAIIKDYQMTALLNEQLKLKLRLSPTNHEYQWHSIYNSQTTTQSACLIHNLNTSSNTYAFDKLKSFEYLLLLSCFNIDEVREVLSKQEDIIYFSEIDAQKLPKRELLKLKNLMM